MVPPGAKIAEVLAEILPPDTRLVFEAMHELRPHVGTAEQLVDQIDGEQRRLGYRLVAVLSDDREAALSVAGFRPGTSLSWGRHLYVDDLVTVPAARGRGHAGRLLAWIGEEAVRLGCREVHLDSAVGPSRADAHRLYLNNGFAIVAHHFRRNLRPPRPTASTDGLA